MKQMHKVIETVAQGNSYEVIGNRKSMSIYEYEYTTGRQEQQQQQKQQML